MYTLLIYNYGDFDYANDDGVMTNAEMKYTLNPLTNSHQIL